MWNRNIVYNEVGRLLYKGCLTDSQREGLEVKLRAFVQYGIRDVRWCAYMLATSFHETGGRLQPIKEWGAGMGKPYGKKRKQDGTEYRHPDKIYFGRGDVQLTWYENYERMGKILNLPLLEHPELALERDISAQILIEGMTRGISGRGDFTGLSLEDFFNARRNDPTQARRIVNGMDRAALIAGYHRKFVEALQYAAV
jgi:putative chitinase